MNRLIALLSTFSLLVLITACGSVPPAPTDRFYRLQPVQISSAPAAASGAIAVNTFSADSLYAERPIIYSDEASLRQLRQYHYHLWLYPPAQLVRENFLASLGSALKRDRRAHRQVRTYALRPEQRGRGGARTQPEGGWQNAPAKDLSGGTARQRRYLGRFRSGDGAGARKNLFGISRRCGAKPLTL